MEVRILVQQNAVMTAWRPLSSCSKWDSGNFGRLFLHDAPVANNQRWTKPLVSGGNYWVDVHSLQWSRVSQQSGNQKRLKRLVYPVMNAMHSTSGDVPVIGELKAEIESLQQEATQARDRYESSRARFMRLAQVAEQLQQRAVVDLKLGNEGNARQLLMEKKKVLRAAVVSKQRSQLYELLSIKLSEAISQKETQLMAALSLIPAKVTVNEEPTVRVIFPKADHPVSFNGVLEQELLEVLSLGVNDQPSSGSSKRRGEISPLLVEAIEGAERAGDTDTGTPVQAEDTDSWSTVGVKNLRRESPKEDRSSERKSHLENAAKGLQRDVLILQEEPQRLSSELESVCDSNNEDVESSSRDEMEGAPDTKETKMNILDNNEEEPGINNGREEFCRVKEETIVTKVDLKLLFEEYLLDIDSQVSRVELKLESFLLTADILLGSNSETKDEKVVLVKNLLHRVRSLRTRILDGVNVSVGQQSQ